MVRHRAGDCETILDHVKAVHRIFRGAHSPARTECAHRSETSLAAIEKIAVERQDHIRTLEFGHQANVAAKTQFCGKALRLAQERLINHPAQPRKNFF